MPQIDTATFLAQVFWTFILFLGFYLIWVRLILPTIATTIKLREKRIDWCKTDLEKTTSDFELFKDSSDKLLIDIFSTMRTHAIEASREGDEWLQKSIDKLYSDENFLVIYQNLIQANVNLIAKSFILHTNLPRREELVNAVLSWYIDAALKKFDELAISAEK